MTVAGFAISCAIGLTACDSGPLSDLFNSGSNKTAPPITGATQMPDIPTLKSNSSIAVLVNEVPITNYDISQRRKLMELGGTKTSDKVATQELIDETLQMYEAKKQGVKVPETQVDGAYASIAKNLKMTPAQLTKALASRGVDSSTLKSRLRAQLTWQYLVQRRTQMTAQIKSSGHRECRAGQGRSQPDDADRVHAAANHLCGVARLFGGNLYAAPS